MRRISAVLLVVLAACGGGGDDADDAASGPSSSTTATAGASESTTTSATTLGDAATTSTTAAATAATTAPAAGAVDAPAPVAPGTYHYRQSGRTSAGPQSFDTPPEGKAVVDAASADGTQVAHRWFDPEGEPSDTFFRFATEGIFISKTVVRQGGMEITCTFEPALAVVHWPPTVGNASAGSGDCGEQLATEVSTEITGRTPVTIDGQSYDAYVIESVITTSGQLESTTEQVDWFVAELRMTTHSETHSSGKFREVAFESSGTTDLVSAVPE